MPSDTLGLAHAANIVGAIEKQGGLTPDQWNQVLEHPDLAAEVRQLILGYETRAYFADYERQLDNVRRWLGNRIWSYSLSDFEAVRAMIPRLPGPTLEPLQATFLVPWLPDYFDTIGLLWRAVRETHPLIMSEFGAELEHLDLANDHASFTGYRVQWVQINLDANFGRPLQRPLGTGAWSSSKHADLAGIELLAAAAHSEGWLRELGGRFHRVILGRCQWQTRGSFTKPALSCASGLTPHLLKVTTTLGTGPFAQPTVKVLGP